MASSSASKPDGIGMGNDHSDRCTGSLPPGFRFRPTDEELLTHYLARKAADAGFDPAAVREVDIYRVEPWDLLPAAAGEDGDGEDDCRYFCARRVKFPSGLRINRATRAGYWKSTGKDKLVLRHGSEDGGGPLGAKKTLVFYRGRAPRGDKTSWVMHEYRLVQGLASCSQTFARGGAQIEWVICRMFMKQKPPGQASQEQETVLHPLCGDHLQMSTDGKTPAAATAAGSELEHPNCFSDGLLQLNYPEADDLSPPALAQATLLGEQLAAADSSFDILPLLLDYEGFPFVHDL